MFNFHRNDVTFPQKWCDLGEVQMVGSKLQVVESELQVVECEVQVLTLLPGQEVMRISWRRWRFGGFMKFCHRLRTPRSARQNSTVYSTINVHTYRYWFWVCVETFPSLLQYFVTGRWKDLATTWKTFMGRWSFEKENKCSGDPLPGRVFLIVLTCT